MLVKVTGYIRVDRAEDMDDAVEQVREMDHEEIHEEICWNMTDVAIGEEELEDE